MQIAAVLRVQPFVQVDEPLLQIPGFPVQPLALRQTVPQHHGGPLHAGQIFHQAFRGNPDGLVPTIELEQGQPQQVVVNAALVVGFQDIQRLLVFPKAMMALTDVCINRAETDLRIGVLLQQAARPLIQTDSLAECPFVIGVQRQHLIKHRAAIDHAEVVGEVLQGFFCLDPAFFIGSVAGALLDDGRLLVGTHALQGKAQQRIGGGLEKVCQRHQRGQIGRAGTALPFGNSAHRHIHSLSQLLLGQIHFFAVIFDIFR